MLDRVSIEVKGTYDPVSFEVCDEGEQGANVSCCTEKTEHPD
jgi:hypothetical protein